VESDPDADADAGGCACPHVVQNGLPSSTLLPQLLQDIIYSLVIDHS
jgi:hypothetical protein